jgi:putative transposase
MRYRRTRCEGGIYFFTLVTRRRLPVFRDAEAIEALRWALGNVAQSHQFATLAFVLLPDHYHTLWRLPTGDSNYSMRWRLVKHGVSRRLGEKNLWQARYWEHLIRDEADFERHADYIHFNPVKHGYVGDPSLWPHSSFARYVERGDYPRGWGAGDIAFDGDFGE